MRMSCSVLVLASSLGLAVPAWAGEAKDAAAAADEKALQAAGVKTDGESLLHFFRQRTLTPDEQVKVEELIRQLGATAFKAREQATAALIARGPVVLELLRQAKKNADLEVSRRADRCIQKIQEKDYPGHVPVAVARLLRQRRPAGAVEGLLAYLPFADTEPVADEVRITLEALAVRDGKPDKALVAALSDKSALLRGAAGEALAKADKIAVAKLLQDADVTVRARVAMALALAGDRDAVPVLIYSLPDLPQGFSWRAEDLLFRLAEGKSPPSVSLGADEAARRKCRDTWLAWWKEHGPKIDMAKLHERPALLGYTLIVLLDQGKVLELGRDDKVRWEIPGVMFPLDAQILPNDRVLLAEYQGSRVTERTIKGDIVWQYRVAGPQSAQRLNNGNTFIITKTQLLEVDRNGTEVFRHALPSGDIMKAAKAPNGEIVCLTSEPKIVRLDSTGKEISSFPVPELSMRLYGGRLHVLPTGRVLVPHNAEHKVVEYDAQGKAVWQVAIDQPIAAVRLPNGNTLVTSMSQNRAIEFDRSGKEVWQFRNPVPGARPPGVTRAFRR
jgi:hypothetical protein